MLILFISIVRYFFWEKLKKGSCELFRFLLIKNNLFSFKKIKLLLFIFLFFGHNISKLVLIIISFTKTFSYKKTKWSRIFFSFVSSSKENKDFLIINSVSFYQTEHFFIGLFFWPGLQLKALLNSSMFDVEPITLKNWKILIKKWTNRVQEKDEYKPKLTKWMHVGFDCFFQIFFFIFRTPYLTKVNKEQLILIVIQAW